MCMHKRTLKEWYMVRSNEYNDRSTSNTLYSESKVTNHNRDCSKSSCLEICKKYIICYIFFEIVNVFVLNTRIGAPMGNKSNKYKK